jgi:hypothetical protein
MSKRRSWTGATYIGAAAVELVELANRTGEPQLTWFNGTPLDAYPGDSPQAVDMRWSYKRLLYQIKVGIERLDDHVPEVEEPGMIP